MLASLAVLLLVVPLPQDAQTNPTSTEGTGEPTAVGTLLFVKSSGQERA